MLVAAAAVTWGVTRALDRGVDALNKAPAVHISVDTDPARVFAGDPPWQTYSFVSPQPLTGLGRAPSDRCREWRSWALRHDGVDGDVTRAFALLQGRANTAVVIDDVDVQVTRRAAPLRGTHGYCPAGGAVASPRLVDIDLDDDPPTVLFAERGDDYPARKRLLITLNGTESEALDLVAHTRRCYCAWRARYIW